jgi:hypothetical protein
VISFKNNTGDKVHDYLGEVIQDSLITNLEQSGYFYVATRERLRDLLKQLGKGDVEFIDSDLGFELCKMDGVNAIVLGSYAKAGNIFVTNAQVLDSMDLVTGDMSFAIEMLAEALSNDARIHEVPISYRPRVGKTKLSPLKDGGRIFGTTLRLIFDIQPLLFFGIIGTEMGIAGLFLHVITFPDVVFPFLLMIGATLFFILGLVIRPIKKLRKSRAVNFGRVA